ncbi:MAG: hypothetical protein LIO51_01525 [Clostridiales bacterium]|nr:hypothetical protein [Clostridiales bacterium]
MTHERQVTLLRLTLERFKGVERLELDFGGKSGTVYGRNGTGKSSIYDAWAWLMTGKDSGGQTLADVNGCSIKPLDGEGNVLDHAAHTAVTGVLSVDGRELTLRREYYEKWTRKRGQAEESYDGNTTDYFVDGVPVQKKLYDETVAQIAPPEQFRVLSDLYTFASLDDRSRRDVLLQVAGLGDEREIMAADERFAPLLAATETDSLEQYTKKVKSLRKKLNDQRAAIPARLDEVKRSVEELAGLPFDELRQSVTDLEAEEARLNGQLSQTGADRTAALRVQVGELENRRNALELENRQYRQQQETARPDPREKRQELNRLQVSYRYESERYHSAQRDAEKYEARLEQSREDWRTAYRERYPGNAICPTCGQTLPAEKQAEAKAVWQEHHEKKLNDAISEGGRMKTLSARSREQAAEVQSRMVELENRIAQAKDELAALEDAPTGEIADLPGFEGRMGEIMAELNEARQALQSATEDAETATRKLRTQKETVSAELRSLREQLAREDILRRAREREKALQQQTREVSEQIAQTDRTLDLIDQFTRYKTEHVTDSINGCFRLARFRLFQRQVDGGLVDCCDVMCGGVPYKGDLNDGARVCVGLDIIDTLSRHYSLRLPVFVDNAESVNADRMPTLDNQVIRLAVTDTDEKVRLEL